jgi:hypothetical protein
MAPADLPSQLFHALAEPPFDRCLRHPNQTLVLRTPERILVDGVDRAYAGGHIEMAVRSDFVREIAKGAQAFEDLPPARLKTDSACRRRGTLEPVQHHRIDPPT